MQWSFELPCEPYKSIQRVEMELQAISKFQGLYIPTSWV
jgi:hypothetical protein